MGVGVNGCRPLPVHLHTRRIRADRAAPGDVLDSSRQVRWNQEIKSRKEGITLESGIRWYRCHRHPAGAERRGSKVYGWIKRHGRVRHIERNGRSSRDGDCLSSKRDRHRCRTEATRLEHASKPDVVAGVDRKSVEIERDRGRKLTTPCWRRCRCWRSRSCGCSRSSSFGCGCRRRRWRWRWRWCWCRWGRTTRLEVQQHQNKAEAITKDILS